MRKAMSDEHGQHVMEMAKTLGGAHGMLADRGPFGELDGGMWNYGYLYARALTIGGGTSEVQRNILGEKVLGLPATSTNWRDQYRLSVAVTPVRSGALAEADRCRCASCRRRSAGRGWRARTRPSGLSQPGTTHACTIHTVFFMNWPCTVSHCARVTSRSGANGTEIPAAPYLMQRFWCRCQWSFGPGKPAGASPLGERDVHEPDEARGRADAVVDVRRRGGADRRCRRAGSRC